MRISVQKFICSIPDCSALSRLSELVSDKYQQLDFFFFIVLICINVHIIGSC